MEKRRRTQDLVQAHKIIHGVDDVESSIWFVSPDQNQHRTRASEWGLRQSGHPPRLEMRKHFFSQRVVPEWNSLPGTTRSTASLKEFKSHLFQE